MTTDVRNYRGNVVDTTLAGSINASTTSITVADGSTYPANRFWIVVDQGTSSEEKIFVTLRVNSVFTVTRAGDNTSASSHSLGAPVKHVLVANDIQQLNDHAVNVTDDVHPQYVLDTDAAATYVPLTAKPVVLSNRVLTNQSTTSTTATDLATVGPSVTVTVPASGVVKLTISASMTITVFAGNAIMFWSASGANTIAVNNQVLAIGGATNTTAQMANTFLITGLTPGSTTFVAKYSTTSGTTAAFFERSMIIETVP
jgi:hypothetical protein